MNAEESGTVTEAREETTSIRMDPIEPLKP